MYGILTAASAFCVFYVLGYPDPSGTPAWLKIGAGWLLAMPLCLWLASCIRLITGKSHSLPRKILLCIGFALMYLFAAFIFVGWLLARFGTWR
ncbi:MAG TPA: hypothetical protein VMZ92_14950 [Planctomycetota bacterium]|nr:hypothetical protein [Planctomycetota bacterium]